MRSVITFILLLINSWATSQALPIDSIDNGPDPSEFDWIHWDEDEWKDNVNDEYKEYYKKKKANTINSEAYEYAAENGIQGPRRYGSFTYDPETEEMTEESEEEFADRLEEWAEKLSDDIETLGVDLAIQLIYTQLEPLLMTIREKNYQLLKEALPKMTGVPASDPILTSQIDKKIQERNFKVWIRIAAENIFNEFFKESANGKYKLQRENIELLKQVGIISFLKMTFVNWEIARSLELKVSENILDYASALKATYESEKDSYLKGKEIYREISMLDKEMGIPQRIDDLYELTKNVMINKFTAQELAIKRKKELAIIYRELAEKHKASANELSGHLKENNYFRMNEAERIKSMQLVNEYISESIHLMQKSDQLLHESYNSNSTALKDALMGHSTMYHRLNEIYGN